MKETLFYGQTDLLSSVGRPGRDIFSVGLPLFGLRIFLLIFVFYFENLSFFFQMRM